MEAELAACNGSGGTEHLSTCVYTEIAEVLARPKFTRVPSDDRRQEVLELLGADPSGSNLRRPYEIVATARTIAIWNWPSPPRRT